MRDTVYFDHNLVESAIQTPTKQGSVQIALDQNVRESLTVIVADVHYMETMVDCTVKWTSSNVTLVHDERLVGRQAKARTYLRLADGGPVRWSFSWMLVVDRLLRRYDVDHPGAVDIALLDVLVREAQRKVRASLEAIARDSAYFDASLYLEICKRKSQTLFAQASCKDEAWLSDASTALGSEGWVPAPEVEQRFDLGTPSSIEDLGSVAWTQATHRIPRCNLKRVEALWSEMEPAYRHATALDDVAGAMVKLASLLSSARLRWAALVRLIPVESDGLVTMKLPQCDVEVVDALQRWWRALPTDALPEASQLVAAVAVRQVRALTSQKGGKPPGSNALDALHAGCAWSAHLFVTGDPAFADAMRAGINDAGLAKPLVMDRSGFRHYAAGICGAPFEPHIVRPPSTSTVRPLK